MFEEEAQKLIDASKGNSLSEHLDKAELVRVLSLHTETIVGLIAEIIKASVDTAKMSGGNVKTEARILNFPEIQKVLLDFPKSQDVNVKNFPDVIKALIKFPEIQKVILAEAIRFPEIQKVIGKIEVDFPEIQKIEGSVNVNFPEIQKIAGGIEIINFRRGKETNATDYIPVRLTDGKAFYEVFSQTVQSSGRTVAKLEELISILQNISIGTVPVVGQKLVASLNVPIKLISATTTVKNGVIIQALSGNSASVYVGGSNVSSSNGFELQAGQATSIAINDVSLLYVVGSANDGVCFIGAR